MSESDTVQHDAEAAAATAIARHAVAPANDAAAPARDQDATRDEVTRRESRRVGVAFAVAALTLALLNADALTRYVGGLSGHWIVEEALILSEDWAAFTDATGLSAPRAAVGDAMDWLRSLRFDGSTEEVDPWFTDSGAQ